MKTIRIACGQGFWGDSPTAPLELIKGGPLDYLVLDYLAEVTMSILARHRAKNPASGYARDFVDLIDQIASDLFDKKVKVIANSGGVNPLACAQAVKAVLEKKGLKEKFKIAVVEGDDILSGVENLIKKGESFKNLDNDRSFSEIKSELRSANAYLGAAGIVQALKDGADLVITGRVADPCLVLAPLIKEFNWSFDDWDKLASGIVAGHIIECGAQCSGGNYSYQLLGVDDLVNIGYPLVEVQENGEFFVTKHPGTGGIVSEQSVKEQLLYEIGDPQSYITPDVIADFTTIELKEVSKNRVKISGVKGKSKPDKLKVSFSYFNGFTASGNLVYSWPDAYKKAEIAAQLVQQRLKKRGYQYQRYSYQLIGANACHHNSKLENLDQLPEVMLRIVVSDKNYQTVEMFTKEIAPLVLNGPSSVSGYFSSKGKVLEEIAFWPALIARELINVKNYLI